jgi:hypothetical protein
MTSAGIRPTRVEEGSPRGSGGAVRDVCVRGCVTRWVRVRLVVNNPLYAITSSSEDEPSTGFTTLYVVTAGYRTPLYQYADIVVTRMVSMYLCGMYLAQCVHLCFNLGEYLFAICYLI